jgi:cell division protein FtsI (penicillin-binding protein 3)
MAETQKVNTRKQILTRSRVVFACIAAFALFLIVSIVRLQNGFEEEFSLEQQKKNTRIKTAYGMRGNIYAYNGSLLATSVPTYDLIWDANVAGLTKSDYELKIDSLSLMFSKHFAPYSFVAWKNKLSKLRKTGNRYAKLGTDLNFDQVKMIKKWPLIRKGRFKAGFWFEEKGKRMYFMGELAKRAIGYTRNGKSIGLEGAFDSLLRGKSVQIMEQRMPGNIWRPVSIGNGETAENGKDIVTTLDVDIQDIAQYALNKALIKHSAHHGCVMVMEVQTGAIVAMANLTKGGNGKYFETMNYAVDEYSEPGSTFKIMSALALLEDKKVQPTDSVPTKKGKVRYFDKDFTDDLHGGPLPTYITLSECISRSSNVGISQFIYNNYSKNPENYLEHIQELGLHLKPNFDIPSSNHPTILEPGSSSWSGVTLPSMSIGYSTQISPLQTLMLYNAIANKGAMMNPYLVKEIRQDGKTLETIEPKVINKKICSERTVVELQKMLRSVVAEGTAENTFDDCQFAVSGKTGTARISSGNKYTNKHRASFVGYFPANQPQFSIIVVISEPNSGDIYGSSVAAPVFKEIANKIYSTRLKTQPEFKGFSTDVVPYVLNGDLEQTKLVLNELGISSHSDISGGQQVVKATKKEKSVELKVINGENNRVPDFRGMGIKDAIALANSFNLKVRFEGHGKVSQQSISPKTRFTQPLTIYLKLNP